MAHRQEGGSASGRDKQSRFGRWNEVGDDGVPGLRSRDPSDNSGRVVKAEAETAWRGAGRVVGVLAKKRPGLRH